MMIIKRLASLATLCGEKNLLRSETRANLERQHLICDLERCKSLKILANLNFNQLAHNSRSAQQFHDAVADGCFRHTMSGLIGDSMLGFFLGIIIF